MDVFWHDPISNCGSKSTYQQDGQENVCMSAMINLQYARTCKHIRILKYG